MFDIKKRKFLELTRRADLVTEQEAIDEILTGVRQVADTVEVPNLLKGLNMSDKLRKQAELRSLINDDNNLTVEGDPLMSPLEAPPA